MDNYFIKVTDKKLIKTICDLLESKGWTIDDGLRSEFGNIEALRVPKEKGFVSGSGFVSLYENSSAHKGTFVSVEELLQFISSRTYKYGAKTYTGFNFNIEGAKFVAVVGTVGTVWAVDDESCGQLQEYLDSYYGQKMKIMGVFRRVPQKGK